jgi:hypothetical protein
MKAVAIRAVLFFLLFLNGVSSFAQSGEVMPEPEAEYGTADPAAAYPVLPPPKEAAPPAAAGGVNWGGLSRASGRFLAVEHGFRMLTEPGTRSGLRGSFFGNYTRAVANLHGWADGDEFYVNYVGHPMQGAVAGFLWVQNDLSYRRSEFGSDPMYWKSRLRAAAFIWGYSTQFEIGLLSEASLGSVQSDFPQQGFVDHVITPTIGMAWMIGEDSLDRFLIKRIEAATGNRWARLAARSVLNPSRSFSNVLGGRVPWYRDTRSGIRTYTPALDRTSFAKPKPPSVEDNEAVPPFEFSPAIQPEWFFGKNGGVLCLGGGASAGFRLTPSWQLVAEIAGCKFSGLEPNLSGDSLTYAVGPRWTNRVRGPWVAHLQFLVGGTKITEERMYTDLKKQLDKDAPHAAYTDDTESNGLTVATGGGISFSLNRALTLRVADLSYRRAWTSPVWGRDYNNSLKLSSGLVLRMGTW